MNPSDFPSDGEFHSFDNSNNEIINVSLEKTAVKTKGGCENFHSITSQCAPTETIGTESTSESDIFEKSSLRGKADLTYLAAASGANLAVEFTEEEEEEESAVTCATRMKIPEHGDAGQLLHSALDRSVRVLNRLQTYGFRGSPSTVNIPSNHLNRHTPETKIPASYNETCESVKTVSQLQKDYQNTPASNLELLRVKELDDDELDDFDGDSLEDFNSPFELKNMDEEFITAGANEPECEDTGLSPLRETVMTEQAFNDDNELKINSESQSESHFVREIMTHQYSDSEYTGSCHSISSATAAVFSSEYEYQTNSTPNESSKGSQSTVVNIGVIRQSPVTSSVLRRDETANKQGKQGSGVTMRESVQLLESRDTLASVESDLNLVDKKIKLSGGSSMLPLGRSLVHLSSNSKKRPINSIPNLLRQKSAAQNDFREPNDGHAISFPHLSQEHQVYEIKDFTEPQGTCVSDSRPHSPQLIIDRAKKQEISNGNVTSTSLSEFERLEKELGTSNSTSPSNGHKGSGEDISSHTSSLSEYLRHEKECEICDERLIIPWDSQLKSKLDEGIDVNAKVKTIFSEMLPSSTVIPAYGQISTIYEDIAEHHISSLSQSIESRSTSPYSNKDAEQISFTYMYHKNEHQSQTGCSDSEVSIIHSKMSCDLLEAEKILESLTSSSEIDFLLDGVDDPLTGVDETDSLIYSSIYDSLIPSVYENSVLEGTSNVIVGTYNNWSDTIAHGIDSLDESEHAQFNKVTDSLCTTSSSVNSNQMSKTETEKADTGSHGITEFDSAHVDVLHQQYIGLIDEKQSCDLLLNETYFIQKVSSISDLNQTHSTLLTEQEDSSTCMSRAVKNEFLNPSMNPNVMTDSLDDSASFGQMSGSVPESKCSLHAGSKRLGVASLSSLITQLGHNLKLDLSPTDSKTSMRAQVKTTVNIGSSSVVEEESATNTFTAIAPSVSYSSLQSSCQTGTEFGLISRIDSNLESNIFDTSEDEIVIEKTFVSNVQKQSLNKIQSDSFATGSHSNVTEKQEVKHSEKLDKIESEESHRSVKLLDQTVTIKGIAFSTLVNVFNLRGQLNPKSLKSK
ncbi:unnamed protein product [Heterobilharzia americana]|nr:unnamed protein product [Heterobilharzia americana]